MGTLTYNADNYHEQVFARVVGADGTTPAVTAANPNANPSTFYADQQVVTASAVALTAQALVNGIAITAKSTNTGKVFIGGATVTTTDDGTGNGYPLSAGQSATLSVSNASTIYIIGTLNDIVYMVGN